MRKAEVIYQQILRVQPNHADALHLSGLTHHQLGKHELAYNLINKAVLLNPAAAPFHNNLGETCRALNRLDEALACFEKATSLQPGFPEVYRNIGLTRLAKGEAELAESGLRHALAQFPGYLGNYWALGLALMNQHKADEAIDIYNKGLAKNPTDSALLCAKGIALRTTGNLEATILHYRHAIELQADVPELHHNLALAFQKQGNSSEAILSLENEIKLNPNAESAQHLLAALQNTPTDRAPASYVRETFDHYADGFDQHLVNELDYRIPKILIKVLQDAMGSPHPLLSILDLGCGTGLFGEEVKNIKKRLVGIDLAPKMINKAEQRQIYDQLIVGDLLNFLAEADSDQFDLITATDVFIYVGNLVPVFKEAARILSPGGWLAFSVEATEACNEGFVLGHSGRYQHGQPYINTMCARYGFDEHHTSTVDIRKEKGKPVAGHLYLLRKAGNT